MRDSKNRNFRALLLWGVGFVLLGGTCTPNPQPLEWFTHRMLPVRVDVIETADRHSEAPYFAFIKFESTFGKANSTQVTFELQDHRVPVPVANPPPPDRFGYFPEHITTKDGEPLPLYLRERLAIGPITPRTAGTASKGVTLFGLVIVAMEADETGWNTSVESQIFELTNQIRTVLQQNVEPVAWDPAGFAINLPYVLEQIPEPERISHQPLGGIWPNPDEPMGAAIILRLGITQEYFDSAVAPWFGALPAPQQCDNGDSYNIEPSCDFFLTNPCTMDDWAWSAASIHASVCPTVPETMSVPFKRVENHGGHWEVEVEFSNQELNPEIPETFEEWELSHAIGRDEGDGWTAHTPLDPAGHMTYGPYVELPSGVHSAWYRLQIDNNSADNLRVVNLDVYDASNGQVIVSRPVHRAEFLDTYSYQWFKLDFWAPSGRALEFRVWWDDVAWIKHDKVEIH